MLHHIFSIPNNNCLLKTIYFIIFLISQIVIEKTTYRK